MSVILPARNEAGAVGSVVRELRRSLDEALGPGKAEILVVDDRSQDETAAEAGAAGARVIALRPPGGYGAAIKTGILNSRGSLIGLMDADATYPAERLTELIAAVEAGADQAVGARRRGQVRVSWTRRPAKWLITRAASILSGREIQDLNSGMRVVRRDRLIPLLRLMPNGFSFSTTLTIFGLLDFWEIAWVPVEYRKRVGRSKFRAVRDTLRLLVSLVRAVVYLAPLRFFLPLAGVLGFVGTLFLLWDIFVERNLTDKTLLSLLAALQLAVLGLLADLIVRRQGAN